MAAHGQVYLVTGGRGFLGSRIVEMLAEREQNVSDIRVYDVAKTNAVNLLDQERSPLTSPPIVNVVGDIRDEQALTEACRGVDVIIHAAAVIDVTGRVPDQVMWDVNVKGTETLLRCCEKEGVPFLVYTSSVEVLGPNSSGDPIIDGHENTPYNHTGHRFTYSRTKAEAETLVLSHNGLVLSTGVTLRTCVLRPMYIYGEGGPVGVFPDWRYADNHGGKLPRISAKGPKVRPVYVGNAAWAHVLAAREIRRQPDVIGGQTYFVSDDTPVTDYSSFHAELLSPLGYTIDDDTLISLRVWYALALLLEMIQWLLKPVLAFRPPMTRGILQLYNTAFYFGYEKARKDLGYQPLFGWEEGKERTTRWLTEYKKEW
ncbi:HSD3B1 [Branchiostoma lanceolatum]|uniref:HSD3B1 protein n=1 Tax=Branchiostoma lanceolatum TaxID=7740 RepID=A0A8J9VD24_BRALA|nr:HSD3B1 [Branchiostoma lanceolatum]